MVDAAKTFALSALSRKEIGEEEIIEAREGGREGGRVLP